MKKIVAAALALCLLCSCSGGVSQADYDAVVKERDELKVQIEQWDTAAHSDAYERACDELNGIFPEAVFTEIDAGKTKILQLTSVLSASQINEEVASKASGMAQDLLRVSGESWFDYDYVYIEIAANGIGRIVSMYMDCNSLSYDAIEWH